jgi:hypothetical protein
MLGGGGGEGRTIVSPCFFPKNFKHDPTATASPELSSSTSSLSPSVKTAMMLSTGSSNCTVPQRPGTLLAPVLTWMMR